MTLSLIQKDESPLGRDITKLVHNAGRQYQRGSKSNRNRRAPNPSMFMTTTERLQACLQDNSMTDVALVGDDGVPVPAIRCVLGSASPVLKHLLYTTSSARHQGPSDSSLSSNSLTTKDDEGFVITLEPQKSLMVPIPGFHSETIKALVEYCCSDGDLRQTSFFKPASSDNESSLISSDPAKAVVEMLDFAQLAINYEIPKVPQQVVDDFVTPLTRRHPQLACIVFNYLLTVEFPDQPNTADSTSSGIITKTSSIIQQKASKKQRRRRKLCRLLLL